MALPTALQSSPVAPWNPVAMFNSPYTRLLRNPDLITSVQNYLFRLAS